MSEYIDKKAVLDMVNSLQYKDVLYPDAAVYNHAIDEVRNLIAIFPTAKIVEVMTEEDVKRWCRKRCCSIITNELFDYLKSGAKMNEVTE